MAGELEKHAKTIRFNFNSGSFMYYHIDTVDFDVIEADAVSLFRLMGLIATYTDDVLITRKPTLDELRELKDLGYSVMLYKSQHSCQRHRDYGSYEAARAAARYTVEDLNKAEAELREANEKVAELTEDIEKDVDLLSKSEQMLNALKTSSPSNYESMMKDHKELLTETIPRRIARNRELLAIWERIRSNRKYIYESILDGISPEILRL